MATNYSDSPLRQIHQERDQWLQDNPSAEKGGKDFIWLYSLGDRTGGKPGAVVEVTREIASWMLNDQRKGTYRIASEEEIKQEFDRQEAERSSIAAAERIRKMNNGVSDPAGIAQAVTEALAKANALQTAAPTPEPPAKDTSDKSKK